MASDGRHIIRRQLFDLEVEERERARPVQDEVSRIFRLYLQKEMEAVIEELAPEGVHIRLNRLEIDLGEIPENDLEFILRNRVPRELKLVLSEQLIGLELYGESKPWIGKKQPVSQSRLSFLLQYLESGFLPASASQEAGQLESWMDEIIELQSDSLRAGLLQMDAEKREGALRRLVMRFPERQRVRLIDRLMGESGAGKKILQEIGEIIRKLRKKAAYRELMKERGAFRVSEISQEVESRVIGLLLGAGSQAKPKTSLSNRLEREAESVIQGKKAGMDLLPEREDLLHREKSKTLPEPENWFGQGSRKEQEEEEAVSESSVQARVDYLIHLIRYGREPWWADNIPEKNPSEVWMFLFEKEKKEFQELLEVLGNTYLASSITRRRELLQNWVNWIPSDKHAEILALPEVGFAGFAGSVAVMLEVLLGRSSSFDSKRASQESWKIIWAYQWEKKSQNFQPLLLLQFSLLNLQQLLKSNWAKVLEDSESWIQIAIEAGQNRFRPLLQMVRQLKMDSSLPAAYVSDPFRWLGQKLEGLEDSDTEIKKIPPGVQDPSDDQLGKHPLPDQERPGQLTLDSDGEEIQTESEVPDSDSYQTGAVDAEADASQIKFPSETEINSSIDELDEQTSEIPEGLPAPDIEGKTKQQSAEETSEEAEELAESKKQAELRNTVEKTPEDSSQLSGQEEKVPDAQKSKKDEQADRREKERVEEDAVSSSSNPDKESLTSPESKDFQDEKSALQKKQDKTSLGVESADVPDVPEEKIFAEKEETKEDSLVREQISDVPDSKRAEEDLQKREGRVSEDFPQEEEGEETIRKEKYGEDQDSKSTYTDESQVRESRLKAPDGEEPSEKFETDEYPYRDPAPDQEEKRPKLKLRGGPEDLEPLKYFFEHGSMSPDLGFTDKESFESWVLELIRNRAGLVRNFLKDNPLQQIRQLLAATFSDKVFLAFVELFSPPKTILDTFLKLIDIQPASDARILIREHLLYFMLNPVGRKNQPEYFRNVFRYLARRRDRSLKEEVREMEGLFEVAGISPTSSLGKQMAVLSKEVAQLPPPRPRRQPKRRQESQAVRRLKEGEPIYIRNAGLVLIWPFWGLYFKTLDMLNSQSKFKGPATAIRAAQLLQYLATGRTDSPEEEMILNKILVGLPIDTPIESEIEMTDFEKGLSDKLFDAVGKQWSRMKNVTPDGLRGTFLLREGRLLLKRENWYLRVEQKGFDMLLDSLPWSIAMVRQPWMQEFVYVEWR